MPDLLDMVSGCLFAPALLTEKVVSPNWDGNIPIPDAVKWLTELEGLARPENEELLARLRQIRNGLAAHVTNDHGKILNKNFNTKDTKGTPTARRKVFIY